MISTHALNTLDAACANSLLLLRSSVTHAMSLGAKELFHTNFLAYLLESDSHELYAARSAVCAVLGYRPALLPEVKLVTWREEHNFDLIVFAVDLKAMRKSSVSELAATTATSPSVARKRKILVRAHWSLVVEAKLKSLPVPEQLAAYDNKLTRLARIEHVDYPGVVFAVSPEGWEKRLLATVDTQAPSWKLVTWREVANGLSGTPSTQLGVPPAQPLPEIVVDYARALDHLSAVAENTIQFAQRAASDNTTLRDFQNQCLSNDFRAIRLHDLVSKLAFDTWRTILLGEHAETWRSELPFGWELHSYTHFSHGLSAVGFQLRRAELPGKKGHRLSIGVLIQGGKYQHFVQTSDKHLHLETIATELIHAWFNAKLELLASPLTGIGGESARAIAPAAPGGRTTNLRKYDESKFLFSAADVADCALSSINLEIAKSMVLARTLLDKLDSWITKDDVRLAS